MDDEELKKNAFLAVFRVLAPQSVIDKTLKITLESKFFRKNFRSCYSISALTDERPARAVRLTSRDSYTLQNLTREKQTFDFRVVIEDTSLLREYRKHHKVTDLKIAGKKVPDASIQNINDNRYFYYAEIEPEEEVEVSFEVTVVRGLNDTEIFYATYPCDGFTAELRVNTDIIKDWGVFPIHDSEVNCAYNIKDKDNGSGEWSIKDTILPYQGMAIWWRDSAPLEQSSAGNPG